jgi:hypothetical protein
MMHPELRPAHQGALVAVHFGELVDRNAFSRVRSVHVDRERVQRDGQLGRGSAIDFSEMFAFGSPDVSACSGNIQRAIDQIRDADTRTTARDLDHDRRFDAFVLLRPRLQQVDHRVRSDDSDDIAPWSVAARPAGHRSSQE